MRQTDPLVRSYAVTHPIGDVRLPTEVGWDQVLYARSGLFVARTTDASWTVPPHRAICVANGEPVRIVTRHRTAMRCLYLRRELGALTAPVRVVTVTGLLREVLLHLIDLAPTDLADPATSAALTLLVDQLAASPTAPLHLPMPDDERCRALAEALVDEPAVGLGEAVRSVPASRRTLERLFKHETGMTLAGWHRRARILAAVELLARPTSVTTTAVSVGYATPSSFVSAFRAELGITPKRFLAEAGNPGRSTPRSSRQGC